MNLGYPEAVAIVGSVGTIALTILQIISKKNKNEEAEEIAVIKNDIANLYERFDRLEHTIDKTQDLFLEMLKDDRD